MISDLALDPSQYAESAFSAVRLAAEPTSTMAGRSLIRMLPRPCAAFGLMSSGNPKINAGGVIVLAPHGYARSPVMVEAAAPSSVMTVSRFTPSPDPAPAGEPGQQGGHVRVELRQQPHLRALVR